MCPLVGTFPRDSLNWFHSPASLPSIPLVDLNPCLLRIHVPNFNGKQTTLGCVLGMLAWAIHRLSSLFFLTSFPLPPLLLNQFGGDLFTRLESQRLGSGGVIVAPSGVILWESPRSLRVGIFFSDFFFSDWPWRGGPWCYYLKYSKLITFKFITYTGYLRDTMLGLPTDYQRFVYYYKIRLQITREEQIKSVWYFFLISHHCVQEVKREGHLPRRV